MNIKHVLTGMFDLLAWIAKRRKNGKEAVIRVSEWTLSHEMIGSTQYGE